jgi:hypothetical protein
MSQEPLPNQPPYAFSVDRGDASASNKEAAELFGLRIAMLSGMKID